jgi:hypothetical protein
MSAKPYRRSYRFPLPMTFEGHERCSRGLKQNIKHAYELFSESDSRVLVATMFLFFLLSSLVDLQAFFCGYTLLPEGTQVQFFILCNLLDLQAFFVGTPSSLRALKYSSSSSVPYLTSRPSTVAKPPP